MIGGEEEDMGVCNIGLDAEGLYGRMREGGAGFLRWDIIDWSFGTCIRYK